MNSGIVTNLIAAKHHKDIVVRQCKTGATTNNRQLRILDVWVMTKSWAHPRTIGYEVKVARSDFLNDKKWMDYLPYCNEFYFVCPAGLIAANELSPEVGLMWVSKNGKMLYTKKKAAYRRIDIPEELYRYILMSRVEITAEYREDERAYWAQWLEDRKLDWQLGQRVSAGLRKIIETKIDAVGTENKRLRSAIEEFEDLEKFCVSLGIDIRTPNFNHWQARDLIRRAIKGDNGELEKLIEKTIAGLTDLKTKISEGRDAIIN